MTAGRRSNPIPQLHCVGGTAGCSSFVPQVVQCYNRGSDGSNVQWECKTDMDNAFRFGRITVICEGYDYADDPYILKRSCGLEYTVDLTEEGIKRKGREIQEGHSYYKDHNSSHYQEKSLTSGEVQSIILLAVIISLFLLVYGIYKTSPRQQKYRKMGNASASFAEMTVPSSGCGAATQPNRGFGDFWTGAMMEHMFSNHNSDSESSDCFPTTYSSSCHFSTGTRTASGFGGTSRR